MVLRVTTDATTPDLEAFPLPGPWPRDVALENDDNADAPEKTAGGVSARPAFAPFDAVHGGSMSPAAMTHEEFEDLVRDAMDTLPDWTMPILEELAVLVEDTPPPGSTRPGTTLLGLYRGIPVTAHGGRVAGSMPGTITLYRLPILSACARREDVPARVLKVLGHEVGHAMGISEAELRELGWF